jgi:branched-chain amino acid transport system substrate-binding protein
MKVRFFARAAGLALAATLAGGSLVSAAPSGPPIKIGLAASLTGYLASTDGNLAAGAKLAVDEINKRGGVDGSPLELTSQDIASSAATAVTVANQLINQTQVDVLLGGVSSAATAALAPIVNAHHVPYIPCAALPSDPSFTFTTLPPVSYIANLEVGYAKKLGVKTVGVIAGSTPYGQLIGKLLADGATAAGMTVVRTDGVDPTATDVTPQLAKLIDGHVEAIMDSFTGPTHLILAKNAAQTGKNIPLIMSTDTSDTVRQATAIYPNVVFVATSAQVYPDVTRAPLKKADDAYFAAAKAAGLDEKVASSDTASRGYDAVYLYAHAVEAAKSHSGDAVRDAFEHMAAWQGATALYKFSADNHAGFPYNPLLVAGFRNGKIAALYGE